MTAGIRSYKDIVAWQKSVDLAVDLYAVTRRFPKFERYAMCDQVQRSGVSIPANIAEGYGKSGPGNYLNALSHARGSLCELETLLIIAGRLRYTTEETSAALARRTDEIGRLLHGLSKAVARSDALGRPDAPATSDLRPRTYRAR